MPETKKKEIILKLNSPVGLSSVIYRWPLQSQVTILDVKQHKQQLGPWGPFLTVTLFIFQMFHNLGRIR